MSLLISSKLILQPTLGLRKELSIEIESAGIKTSDSTRGSGNDEGGIRIQVGRGRCIKAICQARACGSVSEVIRMSKVALMSSRALDVEPVPA